MFTAASVKILNKSWSDPSDQSWITYPNRHKARKLIGATFCEDEPVTKFIMQTVPPDQRLQASEVVFGQPVGRAMWSGSVVGKQNVATGELQAVVALREYDAASGWLDDLVRQWFELTAILTAWVHDQTLPEIFTSSKYKSELDHFSNIGNKFSAETRRWHKEYGPVGPHWYIENVAVAKSAQGQGLGKKLMGKINQGADAANMACYLETVGERNIHVYQKMGYKIVHEITLKDEYDEANPRSVTGVAMVRHPVQQTENSKD